MNELIDIENRAGIARVTCGWKKPELSLERVRPYWRDAHSPAIARRAGIYEYRHYPLDPVRGELIGPLPGIDTVGVASEQLMWLSDVRYEDVAAMEKFGASPGPDERQQILADIEMIVEKSTTYKVVGANGRTLLDRTGIGAPQGSYGSPNYAVFLRSRGTQEAFREAVRELTQQWVRNDAVRRIRISLFETPDMEAERAAGYPIKTHPPEMQYQAWIDLVVEREETLRSLFSVHTDFATEIRAIHVYTAPAVYTFNYRGRPTLSGLRGYPAYAAIASLGATHQEDRALLEWMYGPVARDGASG